MNRAKGLLTSLKLVEWFHKSRTSPSLLSQASQYHHFLSPLLPYSPSSFSSCTPTFLIAQQKLYFSSQPSATFEGLEKELLEKFQATQLTHEAVVYVLKTSMKTPKKAFAFFNWVCDTRGFKPNSIVYNLMLMNMSTKETMKEFWGLTQKMSEEGCYIDKRAFLTIRNQLNKFEMINESKSWWRYYDKTREESAKDSTTKVVVDVVLGSDWSDTVTKKLEEFKAVLSENMVMHIFEGLAVDPLKALSFFLWLKESAGYTHNAVTYNGILRFLCKEKSIEEFWSIVKEMKGAGYDLDWDTYVFISRQFQKKDMVEDLVQLYELTMNGVYKAPDQFCALILNHIGSNSSADMNLAVRVFKKYEATGHALYRGVYDGLYKCLVSAGRFSEADKILDAMRKAGFQPNKVTCHHILFALGKAGKMEEAMQMLDEMEAKGYVPIFKAWNYLIQGQCAGSEIDQALKCVGILLEKNLEINADLMDKLVKTLCTKRRMYYAFSLLTEAVSKSNIKPFQATYIYLIHNLFRDKKFSEGIRLLHLMKKHRFQPTIGPFVEHISKYGTVENAWELLEASSKHPTASAYYHVLRAFLKEGRQSEAQEFLQACPHHVREHADISNGIPSLKPGMLQFEPVLRKSAHHL